MNDAYQRTIYKPFEDVYIKIGSALSDFGFGIITEIDIKKTFKEKLNIDYPKFCILGACNPKLAEKALELQFEVALLMPCNIALWENDDKSISLSAVDAENQLRVTDNDDLIQIGKDVNLMLKSAIDSL